MEQLTVMNWNARSVKKDPKKIGGLKDLLRTHNVDVAVITETHLKPKTRWSVLGYNRVRWDRLEDRGGGVAILVREKIKFRELEPETISIESVGVEIETATGGMLKIFAVYYGEQTGRVARGETQLYQDLNILTRTSGKYLIAGDLNTHHKVLGNPKSNRNGTELFKLAQKKQFTVYFSDGPTFISPDGNPSKLDIFLANFEIDKPVAIDNDLSDHRPVICTITKNWRLQDHNTGITDYNPQDQEMNQEDHSNREISPEELTVEIAKLRRKNGFSELFKHGKRRLADGLLMILNKLWNQDELAQVWTEVRDRQICTKNDTKSSGCCTYSVTILQNAAYWVLYGILVHRMPSAASGFIGKYQTDTSMEAIITLRQILEKCREWNRPTHHLFMDLSASYDTVDRDELWQIMDEYDLQKELTRLIKTTMDHLMPGNGLRRGCALSDLLFNIAIEGIVRRANIEREGTIFERPIQLISYNGYVDLIARSRILKKKYAAFKTEANRVGLVISSRNVRYMRARGSKEVNQTICSPILLSNDKFKAVDKYNFLNSLVTADNDTSEEIQRRIKAGDRAYKKHLETLESTERDYNEKLNIYKTEILPNVLVNHESWIMIDTDKTKLMKFERKVLQTIYDSSARDNNETTMNRADKTIVHLAQVDRLRLVGQLIRKSSDSPIRMVLENDPEGTRRSGGQRARWIGGIEKNLRKIRETGSVFDLAKDSERWEQILRKAIKESLD